MNIAIKLSNYNLDENFFDVAPSNEELVFHLENSVRDAITRQLGLCNQDSVFVLRWVKLAQYVFKPNAVTINTIIDGSPHFVVIKRILSIGKDIYFIEDPLETCFYDEHFHFHEVKYRTQNE